MTTHSNYLYKVSAAGRVNLIGEHVDYCGGKVMPCALSLRCNVYARPNGSNFVNLSWTSLPDTVSIDINNPDEHKNYTHAKYFAGCIALWKKSGHVVKGCDLLVDCSVPFGSGLSSSAAIEVSAIAALALIAGDSPDPIEVALIAQQAEHQYAGVKCGIMDQYASACGKAGHAMLLDCETLECKYVPVRTGDYSIVIINSNKPHNLVESRYNERRAETEQALEILQKHLDISCLAQLQPTQLEKYRHLLTDAVCKRAKHVVDECQRVQQAAVAMQQGDMQAFGQILNASHKSLSELYEVTGRELDILAYAAQSHPACAGSRMTGAGFGGCTVSLVKTEAVDEFKKHVLDLYKSQTGYDAICYDTYIDDGIVWNKI